MIEFETTVYRKSTFTGQYTRWDSSCSRQQNKNLVKCLANRAKKICSPNRLEEELDQIRKILTNNGYPLIVINKIIDQALLPRQPVFGPKPCPVYLTLPWKGDRPSETLKQRVQHAAQSVYWSVAVKVCFTSKPMFRSSHKDCLPSHLLSNVIYHFQCPCGSGYVGKTTQRLETRIQQHVPASLINPRNNKQPACSDSSIGRHLLSNRECLDQYSKECFTIIKKARNDAVLHVLEPIFIKKLKPALCKQMEFVRSLHVFT